MKSWRRLTLRRGDGHVYLDRWGIRTKWFAIYLHHVGAPDPTGDPHDHPWEFITIPLWGGYLERRYDLSARIGKSLVHIPFTTELREPFRPRRMHIDEAHRIIRLAGKTSWQLVLTGPQRCTWGFYTVDGYVPNEAYYGRGVTAEVTR